MSNESFFNLTFKGIVKLKKAKLVIICEKNVINFTAQKF